MFEWSYNVHLLNWAIILNDATAVEMLLNSGVNPRHKDGGCTAFEFVNKCTDKKIFKLLSEKLVLSDEQKQIFETLLTKGEIPLFRTDTVIA